MADHAVIKIDAHPGDPVHVQDAAGKAWAAARLAAQAVVFRTNRLRPRGTDRLRSEVEAAARAATGPRRTLLAGFDAGLNRAFADLHLRCGEDGECPSMAGGRIRAVRADLVPLARRICRG